MAVTLSAPRGCAPDAFGQARRSPSPEGGLESAGGGRLLTAEVHADRSKGPLPRLFRPSAMLSFVDEEALGAFLALPGSFGAVRVGLESLLTNARDEKEYAEGLARLGPQLQPLAKRGAELVVTFARMPRWLASRQDESLAGPFGYSIREASPPRQLGAFGRLVFSTVRTLGRDFGLTPYYEFWNEPNSRSFWVGTPNEFLRTYGAFAAEVRRADPRARVGGIAVGRWNAPWEGEERRDTPALQSFLKGVRGLDLRGGRRASLDFVSWHTFGANPEDGLEGARAVTRWLGAAGFRPDVPQVIDEWNRWSTFPEWPDASRDTVVGAAYIPAALEAMQRAGVAMQTYANLQDFNAAPAGKVFAGDFGLLTRKPVVKKASFQVINMLALLENQRVEASLSEADADALGVGILATARPGRVVALLYRYSGDAVRAANQTLRRAGFWSFEDLNLPVEQVRDFFTAAEEPPLPGARPAVLEALRRARAVARGAALAPAEVRIRVRLEPWPSIRRWEIYLVDETHLNPGGAFKSALGSGASPDEAVRAARRQESFVPWRTGSGELPILLLPRYAVMLLVAEEGA